MQIAEVFGTSILDQSPGAQDLRLRRWCRFRDSPCTKVSKENPVGICALSRAGDATIVCPVRFVEGSRVFRDAAIIAFGGGADVVVLPEYKLLSIPAPEGQTEKKIGKVDFMLGKLDVDRIVDFAALEIQSVYTSGGGVADAFAGYISSGHAGAEGDLGVDFRSSAQKRLVPQLRLKVPIFRRWGKKFFVAIDDTFFAALPEFGRTSAGNSELTWLAYPLRMRDSAPLVLGDPEIHFTEWSKVESALEEGRPPDGPDEVITELQSRIGGKKIARYRVVRT